MAELLTVEQLLKKICQGKEEAGDEYYKYNITPDIDDGGWHDNFLRESGNGLPVGCFGDTPDKIVLHPGHLDYDFDYKWGRGSWCDYCWYTEDRETIIKGTNILITVGKYLLTLGYVVWIVNVSDNVKDHSLPDLTLLTNDFEYKYRYPWIDIVLFVFHFNHEKYC